MNDNQPEALARFIDGMDLIVARAPAGAAVINAVSGLLRELVGTDDWLPDALAKPHPQFYQQYLLHADPQSRYSVVSFVWGPGQKTPVHDHGVWGVIGMLRGEELSQAWRVVEGGIERDGPRERLRPGDTAVVSPETGDVHEVFNAFDDRVSVSIHVYGTDIGRQRRNVFDPVTGAPKEFVSGYANVQRIPT